MKAIAIVLARVLGVGSASNELCDTKGAALRVTAASGVGDVVLRKQGKDI